MIGIMGKAGADINSQWDENVGGDSFKQISLKFVCVSMCEFLADVKKKCVCATITI